VRREERGERREERGERREERREIINNKKQLGFGNIDALKAVYV
jgi:hypothetical protein